MADQWQYASLEWLWADSSIRINVPGVPEQHLRGSYQEVVEALSGLGMQRWEICGSIGVADWVYWTLKRKVG